MDVPLRKKRTKYLTKFCLMKLGQNFVKYFFRFWGNGFSRKNAFEIYWPVDMESFWTEGYAGQIPNSGHELAIFVLWL